MSTEINMSKEIEDLWQSLKLSTSTSSEIQANMKAACELDVQVSCQFANRIYVCFGGLIKRKPYIMLCSHKYTCNGIS